MQAIKEEGCQESYLDVTPMNHTNTSMANSSKDAVMALASWY